MKKAKIYIDEFGNTHLDLSKAGTFSHFVYTSVIISEDSESDARKLRENICKIFRLGDNIKSSNLGDKKHFDKRLKILKYLVENLDFTIDVLVIDKKRIERDNGGLRFKQIFYKYFQKLFVSKYNEIYESYDIFPDKVGEEFIGELELFIRENAINLDLFHPDRTYSISDDIEGEKLIQLADFVAGSVGRIFCTSHSSERMGEIFDIIHPRLTVKHFPYKSNYEIKSTEQDRKKDILIRRLNQEVLETYIKSVETKKESLSINLLEYLAIQNRMNPNRLVPSHEILYYLRNFTPQLTDDKLRLTIRELRYKGLFIISHKGQPGYKLASCYDDIIEHFNHFMRYVIPMLEKLKAINEKMSNSTFNDLNPIEKDARFELVRNLIGQLKNN